MTASEQIDAQHNTMTDWRSGVMKHLRKLIHEVDPDVVEEWKWSTGIWTDRGMVCAVANFSNHVKINFFQGASLSVPEGLFNAGLESKKTRAIDFFENDQLDDKQLKSLIAAAVAYNKNK